MACDLQRPGAVNQLQIVGERAGVQVFAPHPGMSTRRRQNRPAHGDPVAVAAAGLAEAKAKHYDVVIVDTAGRLGIDDELMGQAAAIRDAVDPDEVLFVLDAMIGQDAVTTAEAFREGVGFTGVVLTKLDGDARGGAALSVREVTGVPILFASSGEKLEDFDVFHPDRMASRILGMGDVLSLIEQAEQHFDAEQAEAAAAKIGSGELTLEDFLEQMLAIRKMGPIGNLLGMLPGAGQMKDALAAVDDNQLDRVQAIIRGMTPAERADPKIINGSRRLRIANGSGVTVGEVNQLVDRFFEARKMMSQMAGQMGMPFGRKGSTPQGRPRTRRRARRAAGGRRSRRRATRWAGRHAAGFPGSVEHAEGTGRVAARPRRHRPVQAEVPEEVTATPRALHVRGRGLPDGEPVEWWSSTAAERRTGPGAETVFDGRLDPARPGRRALPCRTRGRDGAVELDEAIAQAETERDAGALLLRDCGFADRHPEPRRPRRTCPASSARAGTWPGPSATSRGLPIDLEDESQLPDSVAEQARFGRRLGQAGRRLDRPVVGDLAPLWSDDVLCRRSTPPTTNGARVTAHVFGEDALPGLINAGIDCIEHGTGLTDDTIELMVEHGTALVPTLINIENFPASPTAAAKYPAYAAHMRDLYATCYQRIGAAREAGVPIYAGTDAGGTIAHGRIADEVEALKGIGMSPTDALGAASWTAREWLGRPGLEHGASRPTWSATPTIRARAPRCSTIRRGHPARPGFLARATQNRGG